MGETYIQSWIAARIISISKEMPGDAKLEGNVPGHLRIQTVPPKLSGHGFSLVRRPQKCLQMT
jgi:hypothetical protein